MAYAGDTSFSPDTGGSTAGETLLPVTFAPLPATAAWQHQQARAGFEVVYFHRLDDGYRVEGRTAAIEDGQTWDVGYEITLDEMWATRRALIVGRSEFGTSTTLLEADGGGEWQVDGVAAPRLSGCLDVDLESSAFTNALPVHRMKLGPDDRAAAPAAYVRAVGLTVDRMEQVYVRGSHRGACQRYRYTAPAFEFTGELVYDESGLVLEYPGLAVRAG